MFEQVIGYLIFGDNKVVVGQTLYIGELGLSITRVLITNDTYFHN